MADGMFGKRIADKPSRQFEIEQWELEGQIVERREPGVTFATVGSASAEVDFPDTGTYVSPTNTGTLPHGRAKHKPASSTPLPENKTTTHL